MHTPDTPASITNNRITAIIQDRSGILWIGTENGISLCRPTEDENNISFTSMYADSTDSNSLSHNAIKAIHEDKKGVIWIGAECGGLNRYNPETKKFTRYTYSAESRDCISSSNVISIHEDRKGTLWAGTDGGGLNRFNPETEEFRNFDVKDGLQDNEFNTHTGCIRKNGEILFGGINGFNAFFPDSIVDNPYIPQVTITDFQLFNKSVPIGKMTDGRTILNRSIEETKEITLS
jgi:ligand-binding sensor domain-containing protein